MAMARVAFFDFWFDPATARLTRSGEDIWLRQRPLRLLIYLLEQPDIVVSKQELMSAIWEGRIVTDDSLTQCMKELRKALAPSGDNLIRTVHGRGYVLEGKFLTTSSGSIRAVSPALDRIEMHLRVAVTPTRDLTREGALSWLAAGLTEDFVSALSRIPQLTVIHPAPHHDNDEGLRAWATGSGIDFVLRTSVRSAGERARLSAQIVDTRTMHQVWVETFDSVLEHVFEAQDEIVRKVAVAAQTELTYGAFAQLWEGGTKSLAAWTEMCAGRAEFLKFNAVAMRDARSRLAKAIAIDPLYTGAMIQLGLCHYWDARFNVDLEREGCLSAAEEMERAALAITPDLPTAHMLRGSLLFLRDRHAEALSACRTAIALSPSDSWAKAYCGLVQVYADQATDALELIAQAKRLSPRPPGWYTYAETLATLAIGDFDQAEALATVNLEQEPDDTASYVNLALALGLRGKSSQTSDVVHALRLRFPRYTMKGFMRSERYRNVAYRDRLAGILVEGGLPAADLSG